MTIMDKLADITAQQVKFLRVLASAGFIEADIARIIKDTSLASKMYEAIRPSITVAVPSWYVSPERQLEKARRLWPNAILPEPPSDFVQQTKTEVLLLHVPDTFDSLWNKVVASEGYANKGGVKSDQANLRRAPNVPSHTEPIWLGFDPEHGKGKRPDSFRSQSNLAANAVLSALIQFPDWSLSWFNGASAPILAGYLVNYDGDWSDVPYLDRWDDDHRLKLYTDWAVYDNSDFASPTVREC